jgi:hypothetical protein
MRAPLPLMLLLLRSVLPLLVRGDGMASAKSSVELEFSAPSKMSSFHQRCAAAGGTDGFQSIGPPDGSHVFGPCSTNTDLKHTGDAGQSWETVQFGPGNSVDDAPLGGQFQWSLVPERDSRGWRSYHTWGGIDVKPTRRTPRSYSGANVTRTFAIDPTTGRFTMGSVDRRVTISGLPHDLNHSFPVTGMSPGLPCFYGGPIRRADGSLLATLGLYWAGEPTTPSPDGPILKMSVVAIESSDGFSWRFLSIVANATSGQNSSVFGPNENDISLQGDRKTILCVLRMDGDGPCDSGSKKANGGTGGDYRYFASSVSSDNGLTWSLPEPIAGAGCVRPKLLSLGANAPLLMSGGRLCVENTTDISLWVNPSGTVGAQQRGDVWTKHSISYWHNALWRGNASDRFHPAWINSSSAWETLAYTSIMPAGGEEEEDEAGRHSSDEAVGATTRSAYVVYQKYSGPKWGQTSESFMMKVIVRTLLDATPRKRYTRSSTPMLTEQQQREAQSWLPAGSVAAAWTNGSAMSM